MKNYSAKNLVIILISLLIVKLDGIFAG